MSTGADDYLDYLDGNEIERKQVEFAVLNLICSLGINAGYPVTVSDLCKAIGSHLYPEPIAGHRTRGRKGAKRGRLPRGTVARRQWGT